MHGIELIVALLLASTVLAGVARAIHVHYAIVLVLGGLAVGLVSGTSAPQVDPHTVLFVFLPPLIYAASFSSSTQDLRAHARTIGLLAVGLVLLSMTAVAAVAHSVAGIGWGPALVLGRDPRTHRSDRGDFRAPAPGRARSDLDDPRG